MFCPRVVGNRSLEPYHRTVVSSLEQTVQLYLSLACTVVTRCNYAVTDIDFPSEIYQMELYPCVAQYQDDQDYCLQTGDSNAQQLLIEGTQSLMVQRTLNFHTDLTTQNGYPHLDWIDGGVDGVDEHHPHDLIDHPQPCFPIAQLILVQQT